jgi:hypothetical protein
MPYSLAKRSAVSFGESFPSLEGFDFLYTPPTFDLLHPERASSQARTPVRRPSITNDNGIDTKPDQNDQVSGAFPSDQSLMRLAGCIMININEEWLPGKKYLMMDVE